MAIRHYLEPTKSSFRETALAGRSRRQSTNRLSLVETEFHADTVDYEQRIYLAGGTISTDQLIAIDRFVKGVHLLKLRHLIFDCGPLAGDSLVASSVKLWYLTQSPSQLTYFNLANSNYSVETGLTGNGTNGYGNTGVNAFRDLSPSNCGLAAYIRTGGNSSCQIGAASFFLGQNNTGNNTYFGGTSLNVTDTTNNGFFSFGARTALQTTIHRNGSRLDPNNRLETFTLPDNAIPILARNISNSILQFTNRSLGMYLIKGFMVDTEEALLYRLVQNLMTDLGRAV